MEPSKEKKIQKKNNCKIIKYNTNIKNNKKKICEEVLSEKRNTSIGKLNSRKSENDSLIKRMNKKQQKLMKIKLKKLKRNSNSNSNKDTSIKTHMKFLPYNVFENECKKIKTEKNSYFVEKKKHNNYSRITYLNDILFSKITTKYKNVFTSFEEGGGTK